MDNNWIYNTVHFINICVLSWYFYHLLQTKLKKGFVWVALVVNVAVFIVYDLILHRFISTYNGYVYAICYICLVAYSFMYFNQLLNNISEKSILNNFNFWLVSGYLINFLGSFIIILLYRTVDYDDTGNVWAMQNIILFLCSIITFVGYLKTSPRKQYL
ncbi:MAG TPA: hypothetical protein VG847_07185 [Chitinophagaceae bacterium]|nr:hypothetical protein [Chitinophagaceae bacterium]